MDWTEKVVKGCRGSNPALENHYDEVLQTGRQQLELLKRETTQEQPTPSKENRSSNATPVREARELPADVVNAITNGLHKDNQEIFGQDYDKKT